MEYVFVYGSLRKGCGHPMHQVLGEGAHLDAMARLPGRLYDLGAYPALVPDATAQGTVLGELYRVPEPGRVLPLLDRYEGCTAEDQDPHEYRRERHTVVLDDGSTRVAWVYVYNRPVAHLEPIPGGDYLNR